MDDRNWRRLRSRGIRLPDARGDGGGSGSQAGFSRGAGRSLLTFAELSALLVVLAGLTYVLGLLALWAPIARTYHHDFVTAWYEVALVPRPVVAGHGVKELLGLPSLALIGLFVLLVGSSFVVGYTRTRFGEGIHVFWILIIFMLASLLIVAWLSRHFKVSATFLLYKGMPILLFLVTSVIYILVAFVSARLLQQGVDLMPGSALPRVTNSKYLEGAVLLIFADLFLFSFVNAAYNDPPLPTVEIHGSMKVEGALLAHTEGYWYVIDEDGQLIATPDTEVTSVHVRPKSN